MSPRATVRALQRLRTRQLQLETYTQQAANGLLENVADPRELSVLAGHYGVMGRPRSLQELGEWLGLSRQRVETIHAKAIERLAAGEPGPPPSADALRKRAEAVRRVRRVRR